MASFSRVFDRLIDFLGLLASVMICLLAFGVATDVIIRALNIGSMPWALEMSEYLLYGVTFLGAPWVLRAGGHVNVDIVVKQLPPRVARWFNFGADIAGFVVSCFLLYYGVQIGITSYEQNVMIYKSLVFPEWWILWPIPLGAICLICEFLRRVVDRKSVV